MQTTRVSFLVFLIGILAFAPVRAAHWNFGFRLCPFEIVFIPPLIETVPVPVGCEVVDCCPGCPGPGPIDWKVRVDGQMMQSAVLRFEGLGPEGLRRLKLSGNARLEKDRIVFGPGESGVAGLPDADGARVAVGFVTPVLDKKQIEAAQRAAARNGAAKNAKDAPDRGIEILQYRDKFVVNRFYLRYGVRLCPVPRPQPQDRIRVTNNTAGDNTVILADYRTAAGCQNDLIHRATSERVIGNALTNGPCNSEVSVFSDDNAMSFQTAVATWTDPAGDLHIANLQPILNVPVSVWVANAGAMATAANDFANANLLYNQNNTGIQFVPTFNNVSGNVAAVAAIGNGCANAAAVQGSAWYTANTINIYYVAGAFTGVNCGLDRNISYIGTTANLGSLPHEIGHAYGLRPSGAGGHTNGLAGFGNNNIMWGGGPGTRNHFSVGQAFRLNVDNGSMLNANGNRAGGTRPCVPNVADNLCPALALDSLPH